MQSLEPFYEQFDPDFINIRKTVREVLQKEDDLNEIVQLVGKVSVIVPYGVPCRQGHFVQLIANIRFILLHVTMLALHS